MKQFKKPSLYRPIIKELSNQQNPGNYNFFFHIYIYINLIFFLDSLFIFFRFSYFFITSNNVK